MCPDFNIKINQREGLLEISGPDQAWVDRKLDQLKDVLVSSAVEASAKRVSASKAGGSKQPSPSTAKKGAQKSGGRKGRRPQRNPELESQLKGDVVGALQKYIADRKTAWSQKQTNQIVIIATFLHDNLEWPGVNEDDLYTVYRVLGEDGPTNFRSALRNAYNRDKFFAGIRDGRYELAVRGEQFGRSGSLNE